MSARSLGEASTARRRPVVSPLRYPGGKSYLYPTLRSVLRANSMREAQYVEPYAGGAGAALGLLVTGEVGRIVVNDLDPSIYAFWRAAVDQPEEFGRRIETARLTVSEWEQHRQVYLNADRQDYLELGFSTFYLNRTNRSGALNGGPIGGKKQTGNYKIDARFNKQTLLERLRLLALYRNRISVSNVDGIDVIEEYCSAANTLIYADPPYFEKAGSLYMNSFTGHDHEELAIAMNSAANANWVLTYDNVPEVPALYRDRRKELVSLNYSAHHVRSAKEVMVFSDALELKGIVL